jgi:hypothetical protein
MNVGILQGLVNGTEQVCFDYEVKAVVDGGTGPVSSLSTGSILNGDEDGWYTIIIRHISGGADDWCMMRLNNDSGANYGFLGIQGVSTAVNSIANTGRTFLYPGGGSTSTNESVFSVVKLYAKSGSVRLVNTLGATKIAGTSVDQITTMGQVWNNTADNITSITFLSINPNCLAVGTRIIILKSNNFTNGTPTGVITTPYIKGSWVRVGSSVLGSSASSVTFSGLDGDRDVLYYLSSSIKAASATGDIKINLNNDTGNNYGYQRLTATNTSAAAARATPSCLYGGVTGTNAYFSQHNTLLFAKQGFLRLAITQTINDITGTTVTAIWTLGQSYNVTNTNITEIDIAVTSNNFDTGSQFDIYALRPNG